LTSEQLAAFQTYYDELVAWNARINITAITGYDEVQVKHFLDSLSCLAVLESGVMARWSDVAVVDIGTGAGFPGLPLKIVRPAMRLMLVEATGKKAAFLEHLIARLGLDGVGVVHARAEKLGHDPAHRERYDLALARAVAELATLAEYALPLCRIGGLFLAQKGAEVNREVEVAQLAITTLGGALREVRPVEVPGLGEPRALVLVEKVAPISAKYPRRPGMPVKRPLKSLSSDS
jgi:16S rRNA (guanine527-N7)-methyltransferase